MNSVTGMSGIIRYFLGKAGLKTKNKHPVTHIEGADNVMVDSSLFCCPVCYNVYSSVPCILHCGHTFCGSCVRNISLRDNLTTMVNNDWVFLCPLCRESCSTKKIVKNYIVEDLLRKVDEIPANKEDRDKLTQSTLRLSKQRFENKCTELEQMNNRLTTELGELKKREMRNYIAVAVFVLAYIVLTTIYGT